jgi:hypothetical protein
MWAWMPPKIELLMYYHHCLCFQGSPVRFVCDYSLKEIGTYIHGIDFSAHDKKTFK